jgi:hypothetical protein
MSYPPESFASAIDIEEAGKLMEDAIHAPSGEEAASKIEEAIPWLSHARDYFRTGAAQGGIYAPLFASLQKQSEDATLKMKGLAEEVRTLEGRELKDFQEVNLYSFQGVLGHLDAQVRRLLEVQNPSI